MHQGALLGSGWARGGGAGSGVVRRAHPASGAQWNVQVVRGKVNGKCLWNACKALSLGLLLMVLGAAMATIGNNLSTSFKNYLNFPRFFAVFQKYFQFLKIFFSKCFSFSINYFINDCF